MNTKRIINVVKYNKRIYKIYRFFGNIIINIISLFIRTDEKLILFISFGGKQYSDSQKAIYEGMLNDYRFSQYKLVWALNGISNNMIPKENVVKTDSLKYYLTALKARCWVTNSTVTRGLHFSG